MRASRSTVLTPMSFNQTRCTENISINVYSGTESAFVSLLTVAILVANLMVIVTINSDKYTKFIHPQVKLNL